MTSEAQTRPARDHGYLAAAGMVLQVLFWGTAALLLMYGLLAFDIRP